jgi:iron complex outermembrane receptor protein
MRLFTILFILLLSTYCFSQDKKDTTKYETEELVITGTRSFERIIDIPFSVFRVDKKELSFGKKVSAKDVLMDVPGLFLQSRFGSNDIRISIRGFGMRSNTGVRGIRILQDGIPESEPDGETTIDAVDFTSLGGVEVVKGNLSSLYANAPGGVVNFLSDLYFTKNFVTSSNQIGKFGFRQNGAKIGLLNADNKFFASYFYRNLDGFRQHSSEDQHLLNAVYEGYIGTNSVISVLGNYVNSFSLMPNSLTQSEFNIDPFQANPVAISQDFRQKTEKGRLAVRYKSTFGKKLNNEIELTGYGGIKELMKADINYISYATRYSLGAIARFTNRSQLFERKNVISVGMDYAYQNGPITEFPNINGNRDVTVQNEYNSNLSNLGFYALEQFNLYADKLDLFLSTRFDKNVFSKEIFIPYGSTDTSRVFSKFTPKLALNYKLTPSIAVYTSYGLGYDIPALSELNNTPVSSGIKYSLNPDLDAQKSNTFELGIKANILNKKSEFMRKLFFEVTFFNYKLTDEIVPFVINQVVFFRNAAKTNRMGVECGFKSEPIEGIELTINYTRTNFKYDEYKAIIYGPSGNTVEDYSGNFVPSVPQDIFNFILNYEFEITENISGLLQWDNDYLTKMYVDDKNSQSTSSYFYGNTMAGITFNYEKFRAIAYAGILNIFDKRYTGYVNTNDFYGRFYSMGEPRNIYSGLNISYRF